MATLSWRSARPIRQVGFHQTLEELAVIGYLEVDHLVDDDGLSKSGGLLKQVHAEADAARGGPGGPLLRHVLNLDAFGPDADLLRPLLDFKAKGLAGRWDGLAR